MTTELQQEQPVGAASHEGVDWHGQAWHAIDWQTAHREVRRLQVRIVKATQEGRWGKVQALQHLLTHSFSGKALAVKRVTENQGKRTPGVDGEIWNTPQKKATALRVLRRRGYQPQPLRRIYIPKSDGKKLRPLGIPTMKDRAMQALYLLALDPIAECQADPNSYGFRKERSTADAIDQCHTVLSNRAGAEWVLEGDIKSCFDRISHDWLVAHVPMDKAILRKWLKAGFIEKNVLRPTNEGTPQGGICSPVLANFALDGLEARLREKYPKASAKAAKAKVNLSRYADDFVITGSSKELLETEIKPLVETFMRERGLQLSAEKTLITHITDGFDFLGQTIRRYSDGKVLVKPSKKNVSTFLAQIRKVITDNAQATARHLIAQLNPKIRGWANYHRHVSSKQTFVMVDNAIFQALWQWAVRRHPKKSKKWVKEKYFYSIAHRNWVFCGMAEGKDGKPYRMCLFYTAEVAIKRHTKIRGEANPYDPEWDAYFEARLGVKMVQHLEGRGQLLYLWQEQNGVCPVCGQKIIELTGWNNHHLVKRVDRGSDRAENRLLLHPNCHRQVHSQRLEVVKPRSEKSV